MNKDYLQLALMTFNGGDWYGWKKEDSDGNKIPNDQRMQYQHIKIIKDGATIPSEADVNAKIQEIKDADAAVITNKTSATNKLKTLGLTDAEIKSLTRA
tara:strand:- start:77 stop:373 length:297 start_codon:yes stop_codon:yes gene_type:complete